MSELWELDRYQSDILMLTNRSIIEYDMKSANTSLAREFGLLPESKIKEIEAMGKKNRVVAIGKIKRDDPNYQEKEKAAFAEARRRFFEENNLTINDIISIKRDAIFVSRYVEKEKVGKYINFRQKNEYTTYVYINPIELYFNPKNGLDIKGMNDEIYQTYHSEYFGSFLCTIMRTLEMCSQEDALKTFRRFWDDYKWRKLDAGYYREFNNLSQFKYLTGETSMEEFMEDVSQLDISYNLQILTKLLKAIML